MSTTTIELERGALPPLPNGDSDALLLRAQELLGQGELVSASASGWLAAVEAMAAYAGGDAMAADRQGFADAARRLVNDYLERGCAGAAEWAVGALALEDNVRYHWLGRDGISHRLDDVQRLLILVQDTIHPPRSADDILRQAQECLTNGRLAVASEKGWQAANHAAKTYAAAMGYDRIRSNYLDQVSHLLMKESGGKDAGAWSIAVDVMLESAYYSPDALHPDVVADGLKAAKNLVSFIASLMPPQHPC